MSNKLIVLIVGVFVLIVAGMFGFAYLKKAEAPAVAVPVQTPVVDAYNITRIDGKHFFSNGVHTVVGEVTMPTACDLLVATSSVSGSGTAAEQVMLDFSVINHSADCAKQSTQARFKVTGVATSSASFKAQFMSKAVELNLTEAAPGETPEKFELYIKG